MDDRIFHAHLYYFFWPLVSEFAVWAVANCGPDADSYRPFADPAGPSLRSVRRDDGDRYPFNWRAPGTLRRVATNCYFGDQERLIFGATPVGTHGPVWSLVLANAADRTIADLNAWLASRGGIVLPAVGSGCYTALTRATFSNLNVANALWDASVSLAEALAGLTVDDIDGTVAGPVDIAYRLVQSGAINSLALLLPIGVLNFNARSGLVFRPPVVLADSRVPVDLHPQFRRVLTQQHSAYVSRERSRPEDERERNRQGGRGCPMGRRIGAVPSGIDLLAGVYLRHVAYLARQVGVAVPECLPSLVSPSSVAEPHRGLAAHFAL